MWRVARNYVCVQQQGWRSRWTCWLWGTIRDLFSSSSSCSLLQGSVTGQGSFGRKPGRGSMGVFATLPAVVVVVMLVYDMGTPISGTAVAQNGGAALPSSSLREH